jgi:hypothetical protein
MDKNAMLTWPEFKEVRPDLAAAGERMFYEHGIGLGFLSTTRRDGGPRVHPITPVFYEGSLFGMIIPGPKLEDLRRDGRYALHCETFPPPRHDDAFYITGIVRQSNDRTLWEGIAKQMLAERQLTEPWPGFERQILFEFLVGSCLVTLTEAHEELPVGHSIWHAAD